MFNPLGKTVVAAAGTPVQCYAGAPLVKGTALFIAALNGNAGKVYVGSPALVKATFVGCIKDLQPGDSILLPTGGVIASMNPEQLYVDADNDGDAILVTVIA